MHNDVKLLAQYRANQVLGRSDFCPRKGYYKILSTWRGYCLNKPSLMANVNWKLSQTDSYPAQILCVQLQSLINTGEYRQRELLASEQCINRELFISEAIFNQNNQQFLITWEFLSQPLNSIDELNKNLQESGHSIDLDSLDDFDIPEDDFDPWDY